MNNEQIRYCLKDRVASIELSRPAQMNALSKQMWLELPQLVQKAVSEGGELLLLRGTDKVFAAGADLRELRELDSFADAESYWLAISKAIESLSTCPLPTLAMIDGPCLGGGCLLALACDLRYASEGSSFGVPIARLGIVLDDLNIGRLCDLVGSARALELLYRGSVIDGGQALAYGLINSLLPKDRLKEAVDAVVTEILANSALSVFAIKQSYLRYLSGSKSHETHDVINSYLQDDFRKRIGRTI